MAEANGGRRSLALLIAATLVAGTFVASARAAGAAGTVHVVCSQAAPGCSHTSVQDAVEDASAGDRVLVRPGSYSGPVAIDVASLTVCGGGLSGTACAGSATAVLGHDGTGPAIDVAAPDVSLTGFSIQGGADPSVRVAAAGSMLRHNQIPGRLRVENGIRTDARLNRWGTNDWSEVEQRFTGGGVAIAAPILLVDGSQDPPVPTVEPGTHCASMGFTPRFVEEAIWCAHPGGSIVFHPSANPADPTPYGAVGGTETITIDRNKVLVSVDAFGEPTFGADDELLAGITLCSAPGGDDVDPPTPELGDCDIVAPARDGTVLDSNLGPTTTLAVLAPDVAVENLTIRNTVISGGDGQAVHVTVAGATLSGNLIDGNLAGNGDPMLDQFGVLVTGGGSDYSISGNEIRNWAHAAVYVADDVAGGGSIGPGNQIFGNGRSGLLIAHKTVAARGTLITGNTIGPNGLRGINLEASDGTVVEDNDISLDLIVIEGLAPGTGAGIWVQGATGARIRDNAMNGNDVAAVVAGDLVVGTTFEVADLVMNRNDIPANTLGLRIGSEVAGLVVDATRNHWGRYTRESVAAAVEGASGNEVDISCFLGPTGAEICPPTPVIESPANGSTSTNSLVSISGSNAESDSVVTVYELPSQLASGTADQFGDWSGGQVTFSGGTHNIKASSVKNTDGIVTRSAFGPVVSFTVDLPATPLITSPFDGAIVPPNFTVTGTGPANSGLRLRNGPATIATTSIDGSGNWAVTLTDQIGTLSLRAFAVRGDGSESGPSNLVRVTVDASVAPAPPVIIVPFEGEVVPTNLVTISGTATPGHTVQVRKFSPSPLALLGTDVADGSGAWSIVTTLPDGIYEIRAVAVSGIGISTSALRKFRVKTDFAAPLRPVITEPSPNSLHPALVTIAGDGEIGSLVTVEEDNVLIGQAVTQADGRWTMDVVMRTGEHTIVAFASDTAGNASPDSDPVTFMVDADAPSVAISTGELTPFIGAAEITGTATDNRGVARVQVQVFDVLGTEVFRGDATLSQQGTRSTNWTIEVSSSPLVLHRVRAVAYDTAGNRSGAKSVRIISVGG